MTKFHQLLLRLASPQTSFGVRLSRIHFMNAWQTNPKGRLWGGYPPTRLSKCYQCSSNVSYEDCDARRIEVNCSPSETCMTLSAIIKNPGKKEEHGFLRGCTSSCLLTQFEGCRPSNVTCDLQCCSSDLCNDHKLAVTDTTPRKPPTTTNLATRSAKGDIFLFANLFILLFSVCF